MLKTGWSRVVVQRPTASNRVPRAAAIAKAAAIALVGCSAAHSAAADRQGGEAVGLHDVMQVLQDYQNGAVSMFSTTCGEICVINVGDYCVGDGVTDDTAGLQAAVADYVAQRDAAALYFPPGTYLVNDTIHIAEKQGASFVTQAGALGSVTSTWMSNSYSARILAGPDFEDTDKPVVDIEGCIGFRWEGIAVDCNDNAAVGIQFRAKTGWGGGNALFENMAVRGFREVGFAAGRNGDDINAADLLFIRAAFRGGAPHAGRVGFKVYHDQSVNHCFMMPNFESLETAIDIPNGGGVSVYAGYSYNIRRLIAVGWRGTNRGSVLVDGFKADCNENGYRTIALEMLEGYNPSAVFVAQIRGFHGTTLQSAFSNARLILRGRAAVKWEGGNLIYKLADMHAESGYVPGLTVENVRGANLASLMGHVDPGCIYEFENCFEDAGLVATPYSTHGPVVHGQVRPAYTLPSYSADRTPPASGTASTAELAEVLATLIADLQERGVVE